MKTKYIFSNTVVLLLLLLNIQTVGQDTIYMSNGEVYTGKIISENETNFEFEFENGTKFLYKNQIREIRPPLKRYEQLIDPDEDFAFIKVVDMPNTSKDVLFGRAALWFADSYKSANNVLQLSDKDNGRLVGHANFYYSTPGSYKSTFSGYVKYSISIFVKDNKYKVDISGFNHEANQAMYGFGLVTANKEFLGKFVWISQKKSNSIWNDLQDAVVYHANLLYMSILVGMSNEAELEDW